MYVYRIMLFLVFGGYLLSPLLMNGWSDPESAWCPHPLAGAEEEA